METDGRRMCEVLVGLGEVDLVGVEELSRDRLRVTIRSCGPRPVCGRCGGRVWSKGDQPVRLVDLPAFGRPVQLRWRKRRWMCPNQECVVKSFAEQDRSVAPERALLTSRAGRWATEQVGRGGRTISEVAAELGCDWHTVNREIVRWGDALLEADVSRFGSVEAVGVDETLFWRKGRWRKKQWCTSVVDVGGRQLLDIVPGRTANSAVGWFRNQPTEWREAIRWAVLDMSGPYQVAYDRVLPHAHQVADPFHVVRLANRCVDLVRRRYRTRHWDTEDEGATRCIGYGGCWSWRLNGSTAAVRHVSRGCCGLVTPMERYVTPGTPRKASGTSIRSETLGWLRSSPGSCPRICRTRHSHQR